MHTNIIASTFSFNDAAKGLETLKVLMNLELKDAKEFDLLSFGIPAAEMQVVRRLQDTAYSEIVSLLNQPIPKDYIPVADRGRANGFGRFEMEEEYNGSEQTMSLEDRLDAAIIAGAMVHRWAQHLASIKDGNAAWATQGFQTKAVWKPVDPKDTEACEVCDERGERLCAWIAAGDTRIAIQSKYVAPKIVSFGTWLKDAFRKADKSKDWSKKLAIALREAGEDTKDLQPMEINPAKAALMNWAEDHAFNRKTSRLYDALVQAADTKWKFDVEQVLEKGNPVKLNNSSSALLAFSPKFHEARKEFASSQELLDALLSNASEQLNLQREGKTMDARKLSRAFITLKSYASEELNEVLGESDEMARLNEHMLVQQAKKDAAARSKALASEALKLDIQEEYIANVLLKEKQNDAAAKALEKRAKALADLLNPPKAAKPKAAKPKLATVKAPKAA